MESALSFQLNSAFKGELAVFLILVYHFPLLVWSHLFIPSADLLVHLLDARP